MKRFIATSSIFAAVIMLVAMMILPHHHHHEKLVIAHCHCLKDAEHEAEHRNKNNCEVDIFISSITRDDINRTGSELIPENVLSAQFSVILPLLNNPVSPVIIEQTSTIPPPFCESPFAEYYLAAQGLRAPPIV